MSPSYLTRATVKVPPVKVSLSLLLYFFSFPLQSLSYFPTLFPPHFIFSLRESKPRRTTLQLLPLLLSARKVGAFCSSESFSFCPVRALFPLPMRLLLLILCFSARLYVASALSSDGLTLLSMLRHWTSVPTPINSSWKASDSTPCSWVGVQCDHAQNVVSLNLTSSGISGQLGSEIGNLNHLQNIVLSTNGFSGIIPLELGNCSLLQYIDFSENHFSGHIPYTLKKLQNLRYISLSSNRLTGEIPESLFQIPHLEEVYLYKNSLIGPIPSSIGNTTELLKLYLSSNQLSGTIPLSVGNCSKLEALFLNENRLKGILPQSLNNLKNLVYLDVRNNSLWGNIPLGSRSCERLSILDLSFNSFSGGIPSGLGNCSSLVEFSAVNSNLQGSIPPSLGLLHELFILRLPENHFSGKIPPEIGNCKSLKKLHLYSNQLEGEIPKELGMLSELQDLELYFNHLTGEIPLSIWKIQSLKHILVHNNSLSGELPSELTELKHLKNISLFDNLFFGVIPQSLGMNSSLVKLDIMNNKFTGYIPPSLCFGKQLRILDMGLNQLQGDIPADLGRCATLRRLILKDNNLTGSLPHFESNLNLIYMDISKNNISGAIPSSLGNCINLTALFLSMNIFTGFMPSELGNLINLQALNLANNKLEGPLPPQLSNCIKMEYFDVGFNFLNGSFPSSLRSWTGLTTLILRENHFTGVIPSFLSEFDQLLELQLGGNLFDGKIPTSMGAMQNLMYGLNLSVNRLTGEMPTEIWHLQKLQSLDVSLNNLTGRIDVFDELFSLNEVNISHNFFVGPVPKVLILVSSPSSFLGNPGLCVSCLSSDGLSCTKTSYLKPCDYDYKDFPKSVNHKVIRKSVQLILELGSSIFVALLLVKLIHMRLSGRRSKEDAITDYEEQEPWPSNDEVGSRIIDLRYKRDVMMATENLDDRYIIGRGGHGIIYKAELKYGVFAVKKLVVARRNKKRLSMLREIEIIRKIRHQHVVRFLGSWMGEDYGLIFYRYMENGSLHDVLHEKNPPPPLRWNVRYKIAVGIAEGLAYLHHGCDPPILHRDIKPKNILIDSDMKPYITDFGIAMALNQSSTKMHWRSTYHIGTPGFMPPEIAFTIVPSCEFDVFSYGVVLLELITRKRVLESTFQEERTTLVGWFKSVWRETRKIEDIVDPSLASEFSDSIAVVQVNKVLLVALLCTQKDPRMRLKMTDVINIFQTDRVHGILAHHDRASFHLGRSLAAAANYILWQEGKIYTEASSWSLLNKVMEATENLSHRYIIGKGAHGVVYKVPLDEAEVFAVKKLAFAGNEGKRLTAVREVRTLGMIRHRNIVKLYNFWLRKDYVLILYMYMSNGSLHDVLHEKNPPPSLEWKVRYNIAVGIAHGLAYLHHECYPAIVHGDIKPKHVLLDYDMEPHITDFGIAKLLYQSSTSTSIAVPGTIGYIAPEKAYTTAYSRESDVYSYGVVLLELITRKKAVDPSFMEGIDIVGWVRSVWGETREIDNIVDSSLVAEFVDSNVLEQVTNVLSVALRCTEKYPRTRPTVRDVIKQFSRC